MGVYIRGMEMPESCEECKIEREFLADDVSFEDHDGFCPIANEYTDEVRNSGRLHSCPLGDVPTPHGRLIDADKLHEATYHRAFETDGDTTWQSGCWVRYRAIEQVQDSQPTIVEAEEEA